MAMPNPHALSSSFRLTADADSQSVAPRRILLAGDNPIAQRLLKVVLVKRGHVVEIADGEQALSKLKEKRFDFVLIDLHEFQLRRDEDCERIQRTAHR